MKTALVTTTINTPRVLRWYRACDPSVRFFVALDEKTDPGATMLCASLGNTLTLPTTQQKIWKCSEPIGFSNIQRRNIAFLEALKWGADLIISVDDDNACINRQFFDDYVNLFAEPFCGLQARATEGFFDIGDFLFPKQKQRGIPYNNTAGLRIDSVVDAKIGVAQGLCIGSADVDAATRFNGSPVVHQVSEIARAGLVVDPDSHTVWNSQNCAIVRELIPAWFMWPFSGRHDDIMASLFCHRIMREFGYVAHYGLPMVFQQRNEHNLVKDMRAEIDGYETVEKLSKVLDSTQLRGQNVIDDCRLLWRTLSTCDWINPKTVVAANAFLTDCESLA